MSTEASTVAQTFIDDEVALKTRLALLEVLTLGSISAEAKKDVLASPSNVKTSIVERAQDANATLNERVERYKPIVQFIQDYQANLGLLQPHQEHRQSENGDSAQSALQQTVPLQSSFALVLEAQSDLVQLERDLRLIQTFVDRDVAGAGKLAELNALGPRLESLKQQLTKRLSEEEELESKAFSLMQRYAEQIDTLSELFVYWDKMLRDVEDALGRIERSGT